MIETKIINRNRGYVLVVDIHESLFTIRHFQYTAYADMDIYVNTNADLKYRGRASIFSND